MKRARFGSAFSTVSLAAGLVAAVSGIADAGVNHPSGSTRAATLSSN